MIIFSTLEDAPEVLCRVRPDDYNFYVFNLSYPKEIGVPLDELTPLYSELYNPASFIGPDNGLIEDPSFDMMYGNTIMGDMNKFFRLMDIISPLYSDPSACVIILIQDTPYRNSVMESLEKLIQQRYGYASYIVKTYEDIENIRDNMSFSPRGIVVAQEDIIRAMSNGYYGPLNSEG